VLSTYRRGGTRSGFLRTPTGTGSKGEGMALGGRARKALRLKFNPPRRQNQGNGLQGNQDR